MEKNRPATGKKRGRPSRGQTKKPMFLQALAHRKGYIAKAAKDIGERYEAIRSWRLRDPIFNEHVKQIIDASIDQAEEALFKAIEEGDPTAIVFYLKTKGRLRGYIERPAINVPLSPMAWPYMDLNADKLLKAQIKERDLAFKDIEEAKELTPMREAEAKAYAIAQSYKSTWIDWGMFIGITPKEQEDQQRAEKVLNHFPKIEKALKDLEDAIEEAPHFTIKEDTMFKRIEDAINRNNLNSPKESTRGLIKRLNKIKRG